MWKKPESPSFLLFSLSLVVIKSILAPAAEENAQRGGHDDEEGDPFGYDPCDVAGVEGRASVCSQMSVRKKKK